MYIFYTLKFSFLKLLYVWPRFTNRLLIILHFADPTHFSHAFMSATLYFNDRSNNILIGPCVNVCIGREVKGMSYVNHSLKRNTIPKSDEKSPNVHILSFRNNVKKKANHSMFSIFKLTPFKENSSTSTSDISSFWFMNVCVFSQIS